jgi:tetratricopeptide (TPR) repeat protein
MQKSFSPTAESAASPGEWRPSSQRGPDKRRAAWLGLVVFVATCATMGRLSAHDFTDWDDKYTIHQNPRLNPPTWESIRYYWTHSEYGLWIPGTYMAWAGLAKIARLSAADERGIWLNPWAFHSASVLLHAMGAVGVYALLRRLLNNRSAEADPTCRGKVDVAAALGALVFAVHPVQVEAVGWASGLKDVLSGVLTITALWQYVAAIQSEKSRERSTRYLIATACFGAAMLCKPSAMVGVAMAVVIDWIILGRPLRVVMKWTALWWLMAIAIAVVAKIVQPGTGVAQTAWYLRPLVAMDALTFYLWKLIWPARLGVDYGRTPAVAQERGWLYVTWLAPVLIALWIAWRPNRWKIGAALLFVAALAPVLGFTRFLFQFYSTVADHYLYLAMVGAAVAVTSLVYRYWRRTVVTLGCVVVLILAARSVVQAGTWRDDMTLFEDALRVNSDSFLGYNNLATAELRAADRAALVGDVIEARQRYERAVNLYSQAIQARKRVNRGIDDYPDAHQNLGTAYARLGMWDRAAIEHQAALRIQLQREGSLQGNIQDLTFSIAQDLHQAGRLEDALHYLDLVLKMNPNHPMAATEKREIEAKIAARARKNAG